MWSHVLVAVSGAVLGGALAAAAMQWRLRRSLAQVRIAERRARSAERLAELGAMTGGLAHEIKNPLSTIGLNAQLLAEGIQDLAAPEEDKSRLGRRVESLRREAERLKGILTDFLEYAGELRLDARPADLNAVVAELVDFFLPQCDRQGVRLRAEASNGPLVARVDVALLKQALLNLMLNAVQAMTRGDGASGRPRELILRTQAGHDADRQAVARVHVIDTGPGIEAGEQERIFRPYYTTRSGGTGLGLPTTRRIVEGHQGRIEVHSEVGRGTDFTIVLPIAGEAEPAAGATPGASPRASTGGVP